MLILNCANDKHIFWTNHNTVLPTDINFASNFDRFDALLINPNQIDQAIKLRHESNWKSDYPQIDQSNFIKPYPELKSLNVPFIIISEQNLNYKGKEKGIFGNIDLYKFLYGMENGILLI